MSQKSLGVATKIKQVMRLVAGGITVSSLTAAATWKLFPAIPKLLVNSGVVGQVCHITKKEAPTTVMKSKAQTQLTP